jgi:hypothetical protein
VFEGLAQAVGEMEIPVDADALVEALAIWDCLEHKLCAAVGAFDAAGAYEADGSSSALAWLRNRGRLSGARASALVRMGRRLRRLAATDAAWARGQLSGSQVAAISANLADDEATAMFAEHEAEVVPALTPLSWLTRRAPCSRGPPLPRR